MDLEKELSIFEVFGATNTHKNVYIFSYFGFISFVQFVLAFILSQGILYFISTQMLDTLTNIVDNYSEVRTVSLQSDALFSYDKLLILYAFVGFGLFISALILIQKKNIKLMDTIKSN